jgi:D-sedoheptulose 7-phosphate isomerase
MTFTEAYLAETKAIVERLPIDRIEALASLLARTRSEGGRVFALGVGGSAANASHLTTDLRRIAGVEAYAPTDNVSELSARVNDDGWTSTFAGWLKVSRLRRGDLVFVLSVGGGDRDRNISPNLVAAIDYARETGASVAGIVGRGDGYTARMADVAVVIPTVNTQTVTPHSEAFQAVIWHLLVSHPLLKQAETKWESVKP